MAREATEAPIVVHRPSLSGGRRVTVHSQGRDEILGTAYSDHDLVVFLEAGGILDPDRVIDDPSWVEWRGGRAHQWDAA
ncbi:hypothetical protein ACWGJT_28250 [Streptomyces xantholiticus]